MNTRLLRMSEARYIRGVPSRFFTGLGQLQPVSMIFDRFDRIVLKCEGVRSDQAAYVGYTLPSHKDHARAALTELISAKENGVQTQCKTVWVRDTIRGVYGEERQAEMVKDVEAGKYYA